jgi:cell wall-associated NlpC family hydrolase
MVLAGPAAATENLIQGDQAVVSGTNGSGLSVRSEPTIDSTVHFVADEGTVMEVTTGLEVIDGISWYGVHINGYDAWVMAQYVDALAEFSQTSSKVRVVNTDGHGLRLRSGASSSAETITVLPEGFVLEVVGENQTDDSGMIWVHVGFNGSNGFAHGDYLESVSGGTNSAAPVEPEDSPAPAAEQNEPIEPEPQEPEPVEIVQPEPEPEPEPQAPEAVEVVEPEPEPDPQPAPAGTNGVAVGGNAEIVNTSGYGLNIRHGAGFGHSVVTVANEGHIVQVLDGPHADGEGSNWWNVDYRGLSGWAHGDYLQGTNAEPTQPGSSTSAGNTGNDNDGNAPAPAGSPVGERIASEAMKFLGYPYVWGGTTPSGFDCSGYIYYVVNQVTGGGFPRSMEGQVNQGSFVPSDQLQPGDLVFQQNTYQWGLSHAGIYIGNGQFIHAATPGSGVVISNLWDSYWGPRYYTARRIS